MSSGDAPDLTLFLDILLSLNEVLSLADTATDR